MRHGLAACLSAAFLATPALAQDSGAPLSAIEWLERAMAAPLPQSVAPAPPVSTDETDFLLPRSTYEEIAVAPLQGIELDSTGLFTAERVGLPRELWGPTPIPEIVTAISELPADTLPAATRLGLRLLMAEFAPPRQIQPEIRGALLLARVDKLITLGALEQAGELIDSAPEASAALRGRAFDIALLLGEEDRACEQMSRQIASEHGHAAQIFCLARRGAWQVAHASLQAATSLDLLNPVEATLLTRFLEEEEEPFPLPPPQTMTPLAWRIMEALGDPVTTTSLPVAYAHADLRGTSGWRAQLDAAERLTRAGVVQPNRLLGLYTERRAAASGGLWERVRIVQALDRAIMQADIAAVSDALIAAWPLFAAVELETAFAMMRAEALAELPLEGEAAEMLWRMLLLAQEMPERASELAPEVPLAQFIMALARGERLPEHPDTHPIASAIGTAFDDQPLPDHVQTGLESGAIGLVLLDALDLIADGAAGDLRAATQGLQRLRALGLEAEARQIAIELMLLERRG